MAEEQTLPYKIGQWLVIAGAGALSALGVGRGYKKLRSATMSDELSELREEFQAMRVEQSRTNAKVEDLQKQVVEGNVDRDGLEREMSAIRVQFIRQNALLERIQGTLASMAAMEERARPDHSAGG